MTNARKRSRRLKGGFTLIEILVATLLLSGSLVLIFKLWSVSRSITERSRDTAEYYAIARQEAERGRVSPASVSPARTGFNYYFNNGTFGSAEFWQYVDYDFNGAPLMTTPGYATSENAARTATLTSGTQYRAVSHFKRDTSTASVAYYQLGIQEILVFSVNGTTVGTTPSYQTAMFFTVGAV